MSNSQRNTPNEYRRVCTLIFFSSKS
jgi:hypothetical protein